MGKLEQMTDFEILRSICLALSKICNNFAVIHKIKEMEQQIITIEQLESRGLHFASCFDKDLIITDHVEDIEIFRYPCRVDGVVVLVCLGGEMDCSVNLKRYHIRENTIMVNFAGDVLQVYNAVNLECYALVLSSQLLGELQIDFKHRLDVYLDVHNNAIAYVPFDDISTLKPYYLLLKKNIEKPQSTAREIITGLVQALSFSIISMMRNSRKSDLSNAEKWSSRTQQIFERFMSLLQDYHNFERMVNFYAKKLSLTPNYLSNVVKVYSGRTALDWINEYVIMEAKMFLKFSGLSIQEIAYHLNFPSQSAFGKYFKKIVGISPKSFRNMQEDVR